VIWNAGLLHPPAALLRVGCPPFATSSGVGLTSISLGASGSGDSFVIAHILCSGYSQQQDGSASVQVFGRRDDEPSMRTGGRRSKSAKARNRGMWGTACAAGAMGIWPRRECRGR
jgi:hypothetical protein